MIIALLIALALYLHRKETAAWAVHAKAAIHEAIADPQDAGHKVASDWAKTSGDIAENLKSRMLWAESTAVMLFLWVLGIAAVLAVARITASALAAGGAAAGEIDTVATWTTVVDGVDTLLWLCAVV